MPNPQLSPVTITPDQQEHYARLRAQFLDSEIRFTAIMQLLDAALMNNARITEGVIFAVEMMREDLQRNSNSVLDFFDEAFGIPLTD